MVESMEYLATKEYIEKMLDLLKELLSDHRFFPNLKFAIVFGSAVRPKDFVVGASDIDVLVVTDGEPRRYHIEIDLYHSKAIITLMSIEKLHRIINDGYPLAFMIYRDSKPIIDDGTYEKLIKTMKPKVTDLTLRVLRRSALAALELGLEKHLYELYRQAASHAYHSIRHAARYRVLKEKSSPEACPISDDEVKDVLTEEERKIFEEIRILRRKEVTKEESMDILDKAGRAVSLILKCNIPRLCKAIDIIEKEAPGLVRLQDKGDKVVIIYEVIRRDETKTIEIA
ncbi:MAG: hypothetical protein ACXQTU_01660 [Candidatus Nezhaarchaeales archaeon]